MAAEQIQAANSWLWKSHVVAEMLTAAFRTCDIEVEWHCNEAESGGVSNLQSEKEAQVVRPRCSTEKECSWQGGSGRGAPDQKARTNFRTSNQQ